VTCWVSTKKGEVGVGGVSTDVQGYMQAAGEVIIKFQLFFNSIKISSMSHSNRRRSNSTPLTRTSPRDSDPKTCPGGLLTFIVIDSRRATAASLPPFVPGFGAF